MQSDRCRARQQPVQGPRLQGLERELAVEVTVQTDVYKRRSLVNETPDVAGKQLGIAFLFDVGPQPRQFLAYVAAVAVEPARRAQLGPGPAPWSVALPNA